MRGVGRSSISLDSIRRTMVEMHDVLGDARRTTND